MGEALDKYLEHAVDPYYDPQKAHEYYERTKELKGRQPAMSKTQTQALGYAKTQISSQRKEQLDKLSDVQKAKIEKLQAHAKAEVDKIEAKLKAFFDSQAQQLIAIPDNASPKMRKILEQQNALKTKKGAKASAAARKAVVGQLRSAVEATRKSYKSNRASAVAKFDKASATEETKIRQNVR